MRVSPRRLRSMAALSAAALCATLPSITAAHAATPTAPTISVTVNSQAPGRTPPTVSGVVDVAATITPVPGAPIQTVQYSIAPGVDGEIVLRTGQCDTTCTVDFTLDTGSLETLAPGGSSVPRVPDGAGTIKVTASSAINSQTVNTTVDVDNHRPQVGLLPGDGGPTIKAERTLTWTVRPSISATAPSGTTIADVELEAPATPLPISHFTENADGSWTVSLDVSSLPTSLQQLYAVATDSNGTVSSEVPATLVLDNGFSLTSSAIPAVMEPTDWGNAYLYYGNTAWAACGVNVNADGAGATDVELLVDGRKWQDSPVDAATLSYTIPYAGDGYLYNCWVPALGNEAAGAANPLPYGKHTLTWMVTDSNGVQESVSASTTVAAPLTSTWPTGSETLPAGTTLHLVPTVTAPDGFSTVRSWSVTNQSGATLASGTGTTPPSATVATPPNQKFGGRLTLHLLSDQGYTTTQSFTYQTGWPTTAFAHASATTVTSGGWIKLTADIWERVAGMWVHDPAQYGQVTWQWTVPGSNVWHNGSAVTASAYSPQPPALWVHPGGSACFRAFYTSAGNETPYGWDDVPGISAPVCVTVKP